MKKHINLFLAALLLGALSAATTQFMPAHAQAGEGLTQSGRSRSCFSGLRQFMAAGIGYEGFTDYFRDFKLWPSQYADVAAIQQQVNKARYAVVASFLRCDTNRLKIVADQYYKLEAELYFVRYFVDTSDGSLKNRLQQFEEREKFIKDMTKFYILRKKSAEPERDSAILSGYFDEFSKKYEEKAKQYASFGKDPAFKDLSAKFDELIKSFKAITKAGSGLGSEEKPKEAKKPEKGDAPPHAGPPKTIKQKAGEVFARLFNACVTTPNEKYCIGGSNPAPEAIRRTPGPKQSFDDVIAAVGQQEVRRIKDLDKVEMLTRYEVLYGEIGGGGTENVLQRLDMLNALITEGIEKNPKRGSFAPLEMVNQCATTVLKRQCK